MAYQSPPAGIIIAWLVCVEGKRNPLRGKADDKSNVPSPENEVEDEITQIPMRLMVPSWEHHESMRTMIIARSLLTSTQCYSCAVDVAATTRCDTV